MYLICIRTHFHKQLISTLHDNEFTCCGLLIKLLEVSTNATEARNSTNTSAEIP